MTASRSNDCERCEWKPDPDMEELSPRAQLHLHAETVDHPLCVICSASLPRGLKQSCLDCLAAVRRALSQLVDLYALLPFYMHGAVYGQPAAPRQGSTSGSDETSIPGGDRLAMLARGSRGLTQLRAPDRVITVWTCRTCGDSDVEDRARHLLEAHDTTTWSQISDLFDLAGERRVDDGLLLDERDDDPGSVAFELTWWEVDWRRIRHEEPASQVTMAVTTAAAYLNRNLSWAAEHYLDFPDFEADVRRLLSRLKTSTATDDRPATGAPCFDCRTPLVRWRKDREVGHGCRGHHDRCDWPYVPHGCTDTGGLPDEWRCPKCRRVYDDNAYWLAVRQEWSVEAAKLRRDRKLKRSGRASG